MTTGRGEGHAIAAGGPARHIPVLRDAAMAALAVNPGGLYVDATFGAGGYARAILDVPSTRLLALDRDPDAVRDGADLVAHMGERLTLVEARFGQLADLARRLGFGQSDGVVFDVGVSSMQFDEADRGFSLRHDGPLDMRMERQGSSAADIVNEADEETLANIIYHYGEERLSRRIARAIVADRTTTPFTTTRPLAKMIARIVPHKPNDVHPATRTFQALRIAVNDELGELVRGLAAAERILKPGGRLAVVTFHSLEDRIVKQFLARRSGRGTARSRLLPGEVALLQPTFLCDLATFGKQPITPGQDELRANPRARSAKLRAGLRTAAPARGIDPAIAALASLPQRTKRKR